MVQDASGAWWQEDRHFDINNHVHLVNLPAPHGKQALEQYEAVNQQQRQPYHQRGAKPGVRRDDRQRRPHRFYIVGPGDGGGL